MQTLMTPTQQRAADRHRAFAAKIAEAAAAVGQAKLQECETSPSVAPTHVEIVEHMESETQVPIVACNGQVVYVDFDKVVEAIRSYDGPAGRRVRIDRIQDAVSKHYGITRTDLLSRRRNADAVRPRHIAMYLAKTLTMKSLPEVGRRFDGRDHTTVLHAVRKIDRQIVTDADLRDEIETIKQELGAAS